MVTIASGTLAVTVLPEHGAKVASLRHRAREWLDQGAPRSPDPTIYAREDAFGWDECFPHVEGEPDHGELWSRPWRVVAATETAIETEIGGVVLPYRFRRRLEVRGDELDVSYELEHTGAEPFACLWAMHPLFSLRPGARIVAGGKTWTMQARADYAEKLFVEAPARAALVDGESWLGLEQDRERCPYLGVWLNEGGWGGLRHVALEPTCGAADDLDGALALGGGWRLDPATTLAWRVRLHAGSGAHGLAAFLRM